MTRALLRVGLALALAALAPSPARAQGDAGVEALARYGCASCHELGGAEVPEGQRCVGCHERVVSAPRSGLGLAPRVTHFLHAPDLRHVTRRLRPDYLVRFLQDPHDVRPRLEESMPRLPIDEADARLLVRALARTAGPLVAPASPAPSAANVARGGEVFRSAGCPACHDLGNRELGVRLPPAALAGLSRAAREAPNLRFVRDRMDPDVALAWLTDPTRVDPNAQMPRPELSAADALAVRDYLYLAELGAPAPAPSPLPPAALTPLSRPVRYAEVRRLFDRSCIHCHAHTDGRSASAFGFAPSSLDLSSPEGVRAGVLLPDGSRRSVLEPDASGLPPLLGRLLRRHEEAARDVVAPGADPLAPVARPLSASPPGMPLGLPPLPREELRLLATWIAQGAPR